MVKGEFMKIPKSLRVGSHEFKIEYPYLFQERDDLYGRTDFAQCRVFLTDRTTAGVVGDESHTNITFWHEVFHIIDRIYCSCNIGKGMSNEEKENLIDSLAEGLTQVLKDNFKIESQ